MSAARVIRDWVEEGPPHVSWRCANEWRCCERDTTDAERASDVAEHTAVICFETVAGADVGEVIRALLQEPVEGAGK